jgi:CBS-domain-containing membrane protein
MNQLPDIKTKLLHFFGIEQRAVGHSEKLVSAAGAFLGILIIFYSSSFFVDAASSYLIVASMGASAVLLFAVPHGPLSQPWPLIGGHLFSAVIGVSCAKFIPDLFFAASIAVGLAVGLMYYLNCIHPPGGATALSAVVGGMEVQQLGYQYVLTPVLINVVAIITVAISFNYLFNWRRYPASLIRKKPSSGQSSETGHAPITHEDFVYALSEIDSFLDISEEDLLTIYDLVTQRHQQTIFPAHELKLGHYYCNGENEELWSVRQIVDWSDASDDGEEKLIYKVVAGADRRNTGVMTKNAFSRWAKYEVTHDENNWRPIGRHVDRPE